MMINDMNIAIADEYSAGLEAELREYFHESLTTQSSWEDRIWFFDKLKRSAGHTDADYKIYFTSIPERHFELVLYWVLLRIRNGLSVNGTSGNVTGIVRFFSFLQRECGDPELSDITRLTIEAYEEYIDGVEDISKSSKEHYWSAVNNLFRDMATWPQMPEVMPVPPGNPFSRTALDRKHVERLIPDVVLEKLDTAYRDKRIPLEYQLQYWILRSIPSRVSEVCSISLECLRPYTYNNKNGFILTIPDFKQSGNQHTSRKKLVHILYEGHGKYLIDLVRKQQANARQAQNLLSPAEQGYLMVSPKERWLELILTENPSYEKHRSRPTILKGPRVRKKMKEIAKFFNITGPDGKPYNAITHAFRHNGITERLYEGFSYVEIRDMSGHKGDSMLSSYIHVKDEEIKALAKEKRDKGEQGPSVLFQGRIMNMTPEREERLLRTTRAYRIGDLGICSDITSCDGDLFECLACEHLVPDADNKEYYIAEVDKWSERVARHTESGNTSLAEHAYYMAELHQKQLDRICLSLEMHSWEDSIGD